VFCKRKDFVPGSGSRICSKHFQEKDFTESSKLQKQLLPNEKIKLYLNSDFIPTIYKVDDLRPKTPRSIRISRKRNEEDIISKQNSTNTSVKKLKVDNSINNFNESDSEDDNVLDIDDPNCIYFSDNPNDKGVQCDLGNECYTFYKPINDISFEIENQEEEYEEEKEYEEEEIYECK